MTGTVMVTCVRQQMILPSARAKREESNDGWRINSVVGLSDISSPSMPASDICGVGYTASCFSDLLRIEEVQFERIE